jgi:DNA (cytosine-5)-methyltransferase 1
LAGAEIVGGLDAWELAAETFQTNFPSAHVANERAEDLDPRAIAAKVGKVDLLLASPECTSHSVAKGSAPRCEMSRATAFEVARYAKALNPRWIIVENVVHMQSWFRFEEWLIEIRALGYNTHKAVINSQDYSTPQARRRLFVLCDRETTPGFPPKARGRRRTVRSILTRGESRGKPWSFRPLVPGVQAEATLKRAERAIKALGHDSEFIIVYYGSDGPGGFQSLNRTLRTVTTHDRFAYVRPTAHGHEMRMLQPSELAAAMGFPATHWWPKTIRRNRIKLIGNSVCPPVMRAIVNHLTCPSARRSVQAERQLARPSVSQIEAVRRMGDGAR